MKKNILAVLIPAIMIAGCNSDNSEKEVRNDETQAVAKPSSGTDSMLVSRFEKANVFFDVDEDGFPSQSELLGQTDQYGKFKLETDTVGEHAILLQASPFVSNLVGSDDLLPHGVLFHVESGQEIISSLNTIVFDEAKKLADRDGLSLENSLNTAKENVTNVLAGVSDLNLDGVFERDFLTSTDTGDRRLEIIARSLAISFSEKNRSWGIESLEELVKVVNQVSNSDLLDTSFYFDVEVVNLGEGLGYVSTVEPSSIYELPLNLENGLKDYFNSLSLKEATALDTAISLPIHDLGVDLSDVNVEVIDESGKEIQTLAGLSIEVRKIENVPNAANQQGTEAEVLGLFIDISGTPSVGGIHTVLIKVSSKSAKQSVVTPFNVEVEHLFDQIEVSESATETVTNLAGKFPSRLSVESSYEVAISPEELKSLFSAPDGKTLDVTLAGLLWNQRKNILDLSSKVDADQSLTEEEKEAKLNEWVAYIPSGSPSGELNISAVAHYMDVDRNSNSVVASRRIVDISTVHLIGTEASTTLQLIEGVDLFVDGEFFGESIKPYKQCYRVKFEGGVIYSSSFDLSTYKACDESASLKQIGTYVSGYNTLIATTSNGNKIAIEAKAILDSEGKVSNQIAISRRYSDGSLNDRIVITKGPKPSGFFSTSVKVPAIVLKKTEQGFINYGDDDRGWEYSNIEVSGLYEVGERSSLGLAIDQPCDVLNYTDGYTNRPDAPIGILGANSSFGEQINSFSVATEGEKCLVAFDVSNLNFVPSQESSYVDIQLVKRPFKRFIEPSWNPNTKRWGGFYRTDMNYIEYFKVRLPATLIEPEPPVVVE